MLCGNFSHVDDDPWFPRSSSSSNRRSRRREKNPYANRGLDKFRMVLADLQARREKIMAQVGAREAFLIRFAESNFRDWVPIIIKLRDPKHQRTEAGSGKNRQLTERSVVSVQKSPVGSSNTKEVIPTVAVSDGGIKERFSCSEKNIKGVVMNMQRPSCYWPVVLILILLCLAMFGRSFAIVCTSVCWYLVPAIRGGNMNLRRSMNKTYGRRVTGRT